MQHVVARRRAGPFAALALAAVAAWGLAMPPTFVAAAAPAILPIPAGSGAGFNLLAITLDTTRADRLGCYGRVDAGTPVLDALAAGGVRFAEAVTVAPETLPAHASIFTGLLPPRHGVRINSESRLDVRLPTLAELMRERGYQTAAFVSAFVLDARFGLDQGFDLFDDAVEAAAGSTFAAGVNERRADATTDAALRWLRRRDGRRPFFAWVHYFDPHAPYAPPAPFAERFAGAPYDGEIAFVDAQIGRLLAGLEETRQREKTIVVVVGDHGESLGEHGERTHSVFLYRSVMRVPLIVANARLLPKPAVIDRAAVSVVDLVPTIAELLGLRDPHRRDGVSLLRAAADPQRSVYMESLAPYLDFGWAPLFGLRRLREAYVRAPRSECYDLAADPRETRNLLAGETKTACADLSSQLRRMLAGWPPVERLAAAEPAADAETRARLQALGYAGGAGAGGAPPDRLPDPKDRIEVSALLVDANALLAGGRPQEALAVAQRALAVAGRERSVLQALGKIYLRLGRLREAEDVLRAFTAIKPKPDVSVLLAQILILDGRIEEAKKLLDAAERLDPRHGGIFIARGDIFARQGRKEEARASYEKARQVDPYRAGGAAASRISGLSGG
jgi:arylsulfatase A-like enzyme/Flp pilus assembly protein TadD